MEKELVEFVVKSLVDAPDEVSVNVIEGEKSTILELKVAQEDVGKVIFLQKSLPSPNSSRTIWIISSA